MNHVGKASLVVAATLVGGLLTGVASASAEPSAGTYTLTNSGSGLCLAIPASGAQLVQQSCDGSAGRQWTLTAQRTLLSKSSGLCAAVANGETGAGKPIVQETCTGSTSQQWTLTANGSAYRVVNVNSAKCVNIKDNSTSAGALVQQNSCDNASTKQWTFAPAGGSTPTPTPTPTPTDPPTDPPPTGGPTGFASVTGYGQAGTSGGAGGSTVTVTTAAALDAALLTPGPLNIRIQGMISLTGMHKVTSDKTIYGAGSTSGITGGGLNVGNCDATSNTHAAAVHNVIVRNLLFRAADDDAIVVQCFSHHVWVDHNDLTGSYDGLVDIKRGSDFVTVSWNHMHDHRKTSLVGHSDGNAGQDAGHLRVTYHHNWFDNTYSRNPRTRFGNPVHSFNNYFLGNDVGVACQRDSGCFVEGNSFENVATPFTNDYAGSYQGTITQRNNLFVNSGPYVSGGAGTVQNPAGFYTYSVAGPTGVKSAVTAGAGVGKIGL